ncbi:lipocalin [Primorskyibacter sp. 2E107]|uniref:lipocalin n=1 Tax=Primorskyibacter sp. 2E107 TaxID=3403458 RepID=UPI003AF72217
MRRVGAMILCGALLGCVPKPLPSVFIPLRNPTVQIASQADVTIPRLAGDWRVVEGAGIAPGARITIEGTTIIINGMRLPFLPEGNGRYAMGPEDIWVHWLDVDNRTAALGEPGGSRVWIMDRTGRPGERLQAARDILAWYGYDLSRMEAP